MNSETFVTRVPEKYIEDVIVNDKYQIPGLTKNGLSINDWLRLNSCLVVPRSRVDSPGFFGVGIGKKSESAIYSMRGVSTHRRSLVVGECFCEVGGMPRLPITVKGVGATGDAYMKLKQKVLLVNRDDPLGFFGNFHSEHERNYSNWGIDLGWPIAGVMGYVVLKNDVKGFLADVWRGDRLADQVLKQVDIVLNNKSDGKNFDKLAQLFRHYAFCSRSTDWSEGLSFDWEGFNKLIGFWLRSGNRDIAGLIGNSLFQTFSNYLEYYEEKYTSRVKPKNNYGYDRLRLDIGLGGEFTDFENNLNYQLTTPTDAFRVDDLRYFVSKYCRDAFDYASIGIINH